MARKILINGDFFCRRLTGIERYAYEISIRLDALSAPGEIALIVPANAPELPLFRNIEIIRHSCNIRSHFIWQMITLQIFLLSHRQYIILEFGNTVLPLSPGIVFLHDIYCEFYAEDFTTYRDKLIRIYNRLQYRLIARIAKRIISVSEFSKQQIIDTFHVASEHIEVIHSSWNHFQNIMPDYTIFERFPILSKPFYFSLGSLSKRKNLAWIFKYAASHPDALFALSGTDISTAKTDRPAGTEGNIIFLGYLDDRCVKALMERCKAFILPSYYEGFGLTPLEALSAGAPIIVAHAASLPEIYGKAAHYIDPYNVDVDLDALLAQPLEDPSALLEKYSYDKSAQKVYSVIKELGK